MRSTHRAVTIAIASVLALALASCSSASDSSQSSTGVQTTKDSAGPVSETSGADQETASETGAVDTSDVTQEQTEETGSGAIAYDFTSSAEDACEAAGAEGVVNYGAATDPSVFSEEIKPFNEKYPNIKVAYTNIRGSDATQRILAEDQAGKNASLDLMAGVLSDFAPLFDQNLILNVDWANLGIDTALVAQRDSGNAWRNYRLTLGIGYNSDRYSADDLPNTWDELLDPKWQGDVIVDPRGEYLAPLGIAWGEDKAMTWFQNFLDTDKPIILQGATASAQKIISGEVSLTTSAANANVAESQAAGAPLAIKYLDIVGTSDYYTMIPNAAQHQNAATCLASWLASPEGMAQVEKYEFKQNLTEPGNLAAGAVLASRDTPEEEQTYVAMATAMSALMQG